MTVIERRQSGQAMLEALLILAFVVAVWGLGANNPVEQILQALAQFLSSYTQGVSRP